EPRDRESPVAGRLSRGARRRVRPTPGSRERRLKSRSPATDSSEHRAEPEPRRRREATFAPVAPVAAARARGLSWKNGPIPGRLQSQMPMIQSQLVMQKEDFDRVLAIIQRLVRDANAKGVFV